MGACRLANWSLLEQQNVTKVHPKQPQIETSSKRSRRLQKGRRTQKDEDKITKWDAIFLSTNPFHAHKTTTDRMKSCSIGASTSNTKYNWRPAASDF